jgi:hypothetical protein
MEEKEIITDKRYMTRIKFALAWILFLCFNFLILYFYPRNIYIDISFALAVFFTFKFLRFHSIHIFLYGASYLILAMLLIFFRNYFLSYRLIDSITFYTPCFLILASLGFIYEEKIDKRITFSKKKISYLLLFLVFGALFICLFISFNLEAPSTKMIINNTKGAISRTFYKEQYYSKKEIVIIGGEKLKEKITISANIADQDIPVSGKIIIDGWAMEKNSVYDTGIDRIEFFLDGKPGEGKYLGRFTENYTPQLETQRFIKNIYFNLYDRFPTMDELNFWSINLEYGYISYYEAASSIIYKYDFMGRDLSTRNFLGRLFSGLLSRDWDGSWVDEMENGLSREAILYTFINSEEFNKLSEDYYNGIVIKNSYLNVIKKDDGIKYGKQFLLSGFRFEFDSTVFQDGEHILYVYAHSPIFGWGHKTLIINLKN